MKCYETSFVIRGSFMLDIDGFNDFNDFNQQELIDNQREDIYNYLVEELTGMQEYNLDVEIEYARIVDK